jgi:Protein of unknown function (DUF1573)
MKKIVLLSAAFVLSLSIMAQTQTETKTKATRAQVATKTAKIQPASKVETKTAATDAPQLVQAQPALQTQPSPDDVIKLNTIKHDFGKIPQGTPVTYAFEIKNTSSKPVVVENTSASCGCTTPEKIVEPIAPGATAKLKVQYNAAGIGSFTKDVNIKLAGISQTKVVQITGEVIAPEVKTPAAVKPNN